MISDEQYDRLCQCARTNRTDSYGLMLQGVILAIGEAALRPGEIFALHHNDVDYTAGLIHVHRQLDLASGVIGWPKDDEPRDITMSPRLHRHLQTMPRLSREYSKLAEHRALARARRAMDAYQQRAQDPSPHPPKQARMT